MGRKVGFLFLGVFLFTLTAPADLQALRCDSRLVSIGDRTFDVRQMCGDPDDRRVRQESRLIRIFREGRLIELLVEVEVEEWTYNLGPYRFIRILRFENDRLVRIDTGGYGY
jgi:hypothetical protein